MNVALTGEQVAELEKGNPFFGSLTRQDQPADTPRRDTSGPLPEPPGLPDWAWTISVPSGCKEGATVQLTLANLPLYERIISCT